MDSRARSQLIVEWNGRCWSLEGRGDTVLTFGSEIGQDVLVSCTYTSRRHAVIRHDDGYFVLEDDSTNGSFVQTEDQQVHFVRRGRFRLWGEGYLSLGEPMSSSTAIRFQHASAVTAAAVAGGC